MDLDKRITYLQVRKCVKNYIIVDYALFRLPVKRKSRIYFSQISKNKNRIKLPTAIYVAYSVTIPFNRGSTFKIFIYISVTISLILILQKLCIFKQFKYVGMCSLQNAGLILYNCNHTKTDRLRSMLN